MGKYTDYLKDQKIKSVEDKYKKLYSGEFTLVLARLLQNKDFRFFLSDLFGFTNPFTSSFEEKGNLASYNSGKQAVGLKVFNDLMAVNPESFLQLMKEEQARKEIYDNMLREALDDDSK